VLDHETDPFIEQIASELRRPVRLDARFDDRVMEAIEAPDVIPLRPLLPRQPWILRPWTISVYPLGALAAAAVFFVIALTARREGSTREPVVAENPTSVTAPVVPVSNASVSNDASIRTHQFLFADPDAKTVAVIGDFNDWDSKRTPMTRVNDAGLWSVTIPMRVGLHEFQFVVNDSLRFNDPTLPKSKSEFGTPNSLVTVGPRDP
jgi:hypothetical protein